ncbi:MAG: hypothetical protein M0C28_03830 [Candidatus Moduliflexus flocculans]|nr:hypothetical protein [Candidatus Moduliflexus flocculans]
MRRAVLRPLPEINEEAPRVFKNDIVVTPEKPPPEQGLSLPQHPRPGPEPGARLTPHPDDRELQSPWSGAHMLFRLTDGSHGPPGP